MYIVLLVSLLTVDWWHAGRELWVMVVSSSPFQHMKGKPDVKYVANIHGNEAVSREMALHLIEVSTHSQETFVPIFFLTIQHSDDWWRNEYVFITLFPDIASIWLKTTGKTLTSVGCWIKREFTSCQVSIQTDSKWLARVLAPVVKEGEQIIHHLVHTHTRALISIHLSRPVRALVMKALFPIFFVACLEKSFSFVTWLRFKILTQVQRPWFWLESKLSRLLQAEH